MNLRRGAGLAVALAAFGGAASAEPPPLPFPYGGPFELIDTSGVTRSQADPDGRHQLLFFGYANCPGMCVMTLPVIADIAEAAGEADLALRPVMITVDPDRDTPEAMAAALRELHPEFVGLTGAPEALAAAYAAYNFRPEVVMEVPGEGPIYSHAGQIFLLSPQGEVLSILPPMIETDAAVAILARYAGTGAAGDG